LEIGKPDDIKALPLANMNPLMVNFAISSFAHESTQLIYKTKYRGWEFWIQMDWKTLVVKPSVLGHFSMVCW
jgi:hypothetical protein